MTEVEMTHGFPVLAQCGDCDQPLKVRWGQEKRIYREDLQESVLHLVITVEPCPECLALPVTLVTTRGTRTHFIIAKLQLFLAKKGTE